MRIERIGDATLYLGNCADVLPTLGKVDAVITDPPYMNMAGGTSITFDSGVAHCAPSKTVGDPWGANLEWVPFALALSEKAFFVFCSFHFVADLRNAVPHKPTALITWFQRNAAPSAANAPQFQTEFCWAWRIGTGLDWRKIKSHYDIPRLQAGCMAVERILNRDGTTAHPTQKPVALMAELMKCGAKTILDPFMGSGTTGVAAIQLGRKFIGVEREPRYFDIACERIENAQRQATLFEPARTAVQESLLS